MTARVASARALGRSTLEGFELRFHKRGWEDGTGKANAFRSGRSDAVVHGVVYEVDGRELSDLDVHETGYQRRALAFAIEGGDGLTTVEAWVYLALPEVIDDALVPMRWYLDHVLAGAKEHGLPAELVRWLEAHPTEG